MKTTFRLLTGALVASLLTASVAMAHHSFAMFDRSVEKVATGTVARWQFNAPHSWLYLNVKSADGTETLWSFEGSAPPHCSRAVSPAAPSSLARRSPSRIAR
jgi:hypothetical protein